MALKLEQIRIYNFKSFAGRHAIAGLDDRMTAVVGPNGSGKSNIIDSILFVLGYRAKKMRHTSLKDLITSGCTECEVELTFNGFRIARGIWTTPGGSAKGCTSRYLLDGEEVSAAAAQEFLKTRGIDLDNNRFLILQGEIENIAMMGPLELLSYVEDCIGTSSLRTEIDGLREEMDGLGDALATATTGLRFAESDFTYKRGKRNEKIGHLAGRYGVLATKCKIVQMKAELARRKSAEAESGLTEMEEKLAAVQGRNAENVALLKELGNRKMALGPSGSEKALLEARKEAGIVQREIKHKEARKQAIEREIAQARAEIADCTSRIESWAKESAAYEAQVIANEKAIGELSSRVEVKRSILDNSEELRRCLAKKKEGEQSLLVLLRQKEVLDKEQSGIEYLKGLIARLEGADSKECRTTEEEALRIEEELKGLGKDMQATRQEIQKRKCRAEDFRFVEEQYKKEQTVINAVRGVRGVHGQLKALGTIDEGYETAVEAATKALGSIVVDTTAAAEECIDIINKKRLNRTTFIILDKLNEPESIARDKTGRASLLYKKVRCDSAYTKAFYYALRDTLVVEGMEEAKRLAFGSARRRVVTMDGKLLEKSGVMSGGRTSRKVKSAQELEGAYDNMQRIMNEKKAVLDAFMCCKANRIQRDKDAMRLTELRKRLAKCEAAFNKDELSRIEAAIQRLKEDVKHYEIDTLPSDIRQLQSEVQSLNEKTQTFEKANQDLRIRLNSRPRDLLGPANAKLQRLEGEQKCLVVPVFDSHRLQNLEEEHLRYTSKVKAISDEMSSIRAAMGEDYHEEAACKAKMDEIRETQDECQRIQRNCQHKGEEIKHEFVQLRTMLAENREPDDPLIYDVQKDPTDDCDLRAAMAEMTDADLRAESRSLIEKLSTADTDGTNATGNGDSPDDAFVCRAIFSEYLQSRSAYEEARATFDFLETKANTLKEKVDELKTLRHSRFIDGFNAVNKSLKTIFYTITFGGNAELDLLNYLDPFSEGIVLSIMPPKKAWKQIANLSGGEKTLSSLALIFALHAFSKSDLYIMDEVDAALDYKNVSIIAQYLQKISAQFIIISLRDNMFERANTLIGVYKTNNASKAVTVHVSKLVP